MYVLCRECTPRGTAFFYMKTVVEVWQGGRLVREDFAVSRLAERDDEQAARLVFERIAAARPPVAPVHLGDVLRDLAVLAAESAPRWLPGEPQQERRQRRRESRPSRRRWPAGRPATAGAGRGRLRGPMAPPGAGAPPGPRPGVAPLTPGPGAEAPGPVPHRGAAGPREGPARPAGATPPEDSPAP